MVCALLAFYIWYKAPSAPQQLCGAALYLSFDDLSQTESSITMQLICSYSLLEQYVFGQTIRHWYNTPPLI